MKKIKLIIITSILIICAFAPQSEGQWVLQNSGVTLQLKSVHALNENRCWVAGDSGTILRTTNGGNNWTKISLGMDKELNGICFANAYIGWAVGNDGVIYRTQNGGLNWIQQNSGTTRNINSVYFINSRTGWAVGDTSIILKTTNRGANWILQSCDVLKILYSVFFLNANTGWITGYTTLKTTDGGVSWLTKVSSTNRRCIFFSNESTGWVVGGTYTMNKSTDGGETWGAQQNENETTDSPPATYTSIYFTDVNTGWYTISHSSGGRIRATTNGGASWFTELPRERNRQLIDIQVLSSGIGWAVGNSGSIFKRSNLNGITITPGNIPSSYSLGQNYPNPFNNTSNLKFEIARHGGSSTGNVKLVVYDVMGREVQTLVNETLQPGTYETTFDGSMLNSGVYFYKLTTDGFTETKRMLLIK